MHESVPLPSEDEGEYGGEPPRLYRARRGRLLLGVCAGAAAYVGWDVWMIRGLFVALLCIGGLGVPVYLGAAIFVPLAPLSEV